MTDLKDFEQNLRLQNLAERTIRGYLYELQKLPKSKRLFKQYLSKHRDNRMLVFAYRKYLQYQRDNDLITSEELEVQLRTFKPPKRRGTNQNGKWYLREQWEGLIENAPHRSAKMGIWIGLQFGLRVGEIINLRVQDIDLDNNYVHIHVRKNWHPKHYRNRSIPITPTQKETLVRWITERPQLDHPYIIYTSRNNQVTERSFQRWCYQAKPESKKGAKDHLKPHDLRRSFAKVLYYDSKKDLKLVQILLGHSNIGTTSRYLGLDTEEVAEKFSQAMG